LRYDKGRFVVDDDRRLAPVDEWLYLAQFVHGAGLKGVEAVAGGRGELDAGSDSLLLP
jgi:hypothetical protein